MPIVNKNRTMLPCINDLVLREEKQPCSDTSDNLVLCHIFSVMSYIMLHRSLIQVVQYNFCFSYNIFFI